MSAQSIKIYSNNKAPSSSAIEQTKSQSHNLSSRVTVYICDLTHTAQTISSEFFPYAVGCIATYLKAHAVNAEKIDVEVFRFPEELSEKMKRKMPNIIGFSNYLWNSDLANNVAKIIKSFDSSIPVIFGGPNFSEVQQEQEDWLVARPWIDFYIRLEGEKAFCKLVDALIDGNLNIDRVKENPFELGSLSYIQNERLKSTALEERIRELDDIPSPYVAGLLDKYFDTSLWPILETNRGCPFSCNFCSEGYSYYNKVNKRSNECIKAELNSIAQKHKNQKMMFFADSNFLMFKENLEIAEEIGKLQELYDWPAFVGCSTGKNSQSTVIAGASKLRKSTITLAASVQSLDPEVLENIKRRNISSDGLIDLTQQAGEINQDTYSEVIACLPGDTLEKFKETIKKLIEANLSIIKTHTLLLIHGTELAEPESRKKFGFKTMYRPVSKSFGNYEFLDIKFFAVEAEEIVVGTSSLPHEDYLECRRLQLSVQLFYNDNLFYEVHALLRSIGISVWEWLYKVHLSLNNLNDRTKTLYESYMREVHEELWENEGDIYEHARDNLHEYMNGLRGNNVTFKHRALLIMEYTADVLSAGIDVAKNLVIQREIEGKENICVYLDELLQLMKARKCNTFDADVDYIADLTFPMEFYKEPSIEKIQSEVNGSRKKQQVIFKHSKNQRQMLEDFFADHEYSVLDVASFLNRVPAASLYRS